MKEVYCTVSYPVGVYINIDENRLGDEEYVENIQNEICDAADKVMETSPPKPVITDSNIDELIE